MSAEGEDEAMRVLGETVLAMLAADAPASDVRDVRAVMKLAVAVAGELREDLVQHTLFYPAFTSFSLGFSTTLACAHRAKHSSARTIRRLSRRQTEACITWGVTVATFYLALVETAGLFGKQSDLALYGIEDKWRLLSDERRWLCFDRVLQCAASGRTAAEAWCDDESADVPPYFVDALESFLTTTLGKGVVRAKDTPNFIANRVGIAGMLATMKEAQNFGLSFDIVDDLTGKKLGRASSGTFRTADVVGLDTMAHVIRTMQDNLGAGKAVLTPERVAGYLAEMDAANVHTVVNLDGMWGERLRETLAALDEALPLADGESESVCGPGPPDEAKGEPGPAPPPVASAAAPSSA
jgi:hypothetical protein